MILGMLNHFSALESMYENHSFFSLKLSVIEFSIIISWFCIQIQHRIRKYRKILTFALQSSSISGDRFSKQIFIKFWLIDFFFIKWTRILTWTLAGWAKIIGRWNRFPIFFYRNQFSFPVITNFYFCLKNKIYFWNVFFLFKWKIDYLIFFKPPLYFENDFGWLRFYFSEIQL